MLIFFSLYLAAKAPLKKTLLYAKLLPGIIALVILLQVLFGGGLSTGLMISCRIVALLVLMPMLTETTGTPALALGLTRLGLNYRAAYVITATLNLVPSFEEEARLIMDARRLRGMKSVKLKEYPSIVLPLMIKAMRKAQLAALAMDARAFGAYRNRTWQREITMSARDYGAFVAATVLSAAALTANFLLKR